MRMPTKERPSSADSKQPFSIPVVRLLTLADYAATAVLETSKGLPARSKGEWERQWTGNPAYDSTIPMGWVLEDPATGMLVGTLSNIPLNYTFRGRNLRAVTARNLAVDPSFDSFASLLLSEYLCQKVDIILNTAMQTNSSEQTPTPVGDWTKAAYRVINHGSFAETALRLKGLPEMIAGVVGAGLWLKDLLTAPALPKRTNACAVSVQAEFDEKFDDFWEELRLVKCDTLLGVRDAAALRWRFDGGKPRRILVAERWGILIGYAVLVRDDRAGLRRYRVADVQCAEDIANPALARYAVQVCQEDGVDTLEVVGCGLPAMAEFERMCGYRRNLPESNYLYTTRDSGLAAELADPAVWEPFAFDRDTTI
jgi:hypothetical protein